MVTMEKKYSPASVRWPADLKAALDKRAEADGRSFSNYVIQVLREHVETVPLPVRRKARN